MSRDGEEDEDEEGFHDSLDRLLSSSNTSCSCTPSHSEDEDPNCNYYPDYNAFRPNPVPRFPVCVYNDYDVWIAQPSSVEERRLRLVRQMGLTKDPSLLRHRPSLSSSDRFPDLFNPSASSDHFNTSETFVPSGRLRLGFQAPEPTGTSRKKRKLANLGHLIKYIFANFGL
ncbi:Transducin/WD40 repeat-like superfamily protein [Abeliophyllum distichum]|uniref:Transducin/WD40 repeat-like superfamily protein n=1 Tax=Abeliophyllum distichum TaxID=126358 RepID=A0ABD1RUD8_9LAMI